MLFKKATIVLFIMVFMLSALIGCSSKEESKPVTIQYWHTQTEEERVKVIDELIAGFQEQHPAITVEQIPTPEGDFPAKISASLAANKMPAVVEIGIGQLLKLGSEEVLDVAANAKVIDEAGKDDYFKGALEMVKTSDGSGYYGIPFYGWVQGIWYRSDLFEEKGLEPPTTWDNILKAAKAFHDPANKKYGIVIGTMKDDFARQTFSQYALSNGARLLDDNGKVNFNTPEMVEALGFYKQLAAYTPPGQETWREARDLYLNENIPMMMYSTYIMDDLLLDSEEGKLAKVTKLATPISNKRASTFGQIVTLSIVSTVSEEEKEAANEFIQYLMSKEANIKYMHMSPGGNQPAKQSIAKDADYLDNEIIQAYGQRAVDIASGLDNLERFEFQNGKVYPKVGDISAQFVIGDAISQMIEKDWTPEETAEWADKKMKQIVGE